MEFLATIADVLFGWALDANASNYSTIINSDVLAWVLICLFIVTFAAVLFFYFSIAKVAANATKKNYLIVFGLGLLVLWLANFIIVPTIIGDWEYALEMNNLILTLVDSVYYVLLYELFSIFVKDTSNAKHLHLFNCLFNCLS